MVSAACTEYRTVQVKEGSLANTYPQLTVKGTGFDRTLGGLEMDMRLRDMLAKNFEVSAFNQLASFSHSTSLCIHSPSSH